MREATLPTLPGARPFDGVWDLHVKLSAVECIAIVFFAYIGVAGLAFHLPARDFAIIMALNAVTFGTLLALQRNRRRARWLDAAGNCFPGLLLLVAYRETGLLLTPDSSHHLDNAFITWDRFLLQNHFVQAVLQAGTPWLQHYLEFAYLFCYPLVLLGAAAVHFTTQRSRGRDFLAASDERVMNRYWAIVLLATLFCYAVYPFFPLTPPRVLFGDVPGPHAEPLLRRLNFWLLDHYSVQACIFPSGHVAAATAVALAVRKHAPRLGGWFLFAAASVAAATIYGRYHYAADALAGALVGLAAYGVLQLSSQDRARQETGRDQLRLDPKLRGQQLTSRVGGG